MPEDSEDDAFSEPRTPSLDGVQSDEYITEDGAMSLSPPPSPSMSLHSLGMSPLSPLRHSPVLHRTAKPQYPATVDEDSNQQDLSQDSRDVLVQRLNDLVSRLSGDGGLVGDGIANLHARVDEMEHILGQSSSPQPQKGHRGNQSSVESSSYVGGDGASMLSGLPSPAQPKSPSADASSSDARTEAVPPQQQQQQQSRQSEPEEEARPQRRRSHFGDPSDHARKVLRDAEQLREAMLGVITNLKARQEEQDHIHSLLITRAERAAQRIIYLEDRVQELEDEQSEGEMDILNLQIQLSAIEVQCLGYVPQDADPELVESINHWKAEWDAVKRKRALKKEESANSFFEPPKEQQLRAYAMAVRTPPT
ncbi:hypothetical protein PG985_009175 [Apiospora marii]|uniref:uncharacterized protein n=1 Tax=Apiospora marii TaxID=335849 RepID=UPI003131DD29